MTPSQALAISLAYIIDADKKREAEEKAAMVAVLGKLVTHGEITERGMAELAKYAFDYADKTPIETFLSEAAPLLSPMQKVAIYINALELMLVDGTVIEAEQHLLKKIQDAFFIDREQMLAIREILFLKNDTRMFTHPEHPRNAPDATLAVRYQPRRTD